jgi:hypothetical protein
MTKPLPTNPGALQLLQARKRAAKETERAVNDPAVIQLAALMLAYDALQVRIAQGANFSVDELLRLDEALAAARAKAVPVPKVEVNFVEGVVGIFDCPHCHKRSEIPDYRAPALPSSAAPGAPSGHRFGPVRRGNDDDDDGPGGVDDGSGSGAGGAGGGAVEPLPEPAAAAPAKPVPKPAAPRRKSNSDLHRQFHGGGLLRGDQQITDNDAAPVVSIASANYTASRLYGERWANPVRHGSPYRNFG